MANWITANYVFIGDKDDVDALYDKLKEIEKTGDHRFHRMSRRYG